MKTLLVETLIGIPEIIYLILFRFTVVVSEQNYARAFEFIFRFGICCCFVVSCFQEEHP